MSSASGRTWRGAVLGHQLADLLVVVVAVRGGPVDDVKVDRERREELAPSGGRRERSADGRQQLLEQALEHWVGQRIGLVERPCAPAGASPRPAASRRMVRLYVHQGEQQRLDQPVTVRGLEKSSLIG